MVMTVCVINFSLGIPYSKKFSQIGHKPQKILTEKNLLPGSQALATGMAGPH